MSSEKQKRILIIRPDRIGDVILSTPIPREIKKAFPECFIGVLLREYTKDIYVNNPNVDKIFIDSERTDLKSIFQLIKEIHLYDFTHAFMLLPTERINWILFFAGIKHRVGAEHKFYQFITNTKSVHRRKYIPLRHEADYCMDMARKIGIESNNLDTEICLSDEEKIIVNSLREKFRAKKKHLVGIHTTSGNSAPNWGPSTYRKLIERIKHVQDIQILITDLVVPDEVKNIDDVLYPPKEVLRNLIYIISSLDLLISSSTGPMHIAAALKIPTISLFCPLSACSPELWGPKGNRAINILPDENYCGVVCSGNPKQCTFEGEGGISVESVYEEVIKFIKNR